MDLIKFITKEKSFTTMAWEYHVELTNGLLIKFTLPEEMMMKGGKEWESHYIQKMILDALSGVVAKEVAQKINNIPKIPQSDHYKPLWATDIEKSYDQIAKDELKANLFAKMYGGEVKKQEDEDLTINTVSTASLYDQVKSGEPPNVSAEALKQLGQSILDGTVEQDNLTQSLDYFKKLDQAKQGKIEIKKPKPNPKTGLSPGSGFSGSTVVAEIAKFVPAIKTFIVKKCPARIEGEKCPHSMPPNGAVLKDMIIALNDTHLWTREQIADWLETLDCDITIGEPKLPDEIIKKQGKLLPESFDEIGSTVPPALPPTANQFNADYWIKWAEKELAKMTAKDIAKKVEWLPGPITEEQVLKAADAIKKNPYTGNPYPKFPHII